MIATQLTQLVGQTPMLRMERLCKSESLQAHIISKLEYFNPAGSIKDRIALSMVLDAEKRGHLALGGTIVEPTSGNTGIGLAMVCAVKGYRLILTMPESMSMERRLLLKAYGAELVLTPANQGMNGAINRANQLLAEISGSVMLQQFENPANAEAHYYGTADEIIASMGERQVDYLVCGVGTGGTITGTGRRLREVYPALVCVAVEPADSPVLSGGKAGPHGIQGIGAGFVPAVLDQSIISEVMQVTTDAAYQGARLSARLEGALIGISSGAALWAAMQIARRSEAYGKNIVVICPDGGDRYLSTPLFA